MKSSTHSWLYIAQENQVQLNFLFSFFSLNYSTNGKEKCKKKKKKHIFFLFGYETGKCNTKKVWRQCTHSQSKKLDLIVLLNVSLPQSKNKAFFFFFHHIFFSMWPNKVLKIDQIWTFSFPPLCHLISLKPTAF